MKPKGYLLVLDPRSIAGTLYLHGNNDGTISAGELVCPVLFCTEIAMDSPFGIFAKRPLSAPKSHQSIYLPYGSVAKIVHVQETEQMPFGFSPPSAD